MKMLQDPFLGEGLQEASLPPNAAYDSLESYLILTRNQAGGVIRALARAGSR